MQLVENYERDDYQYLPPAPGEWRGGQSDIEIERDWVTDSRPKVKISSIDKTQSYLSFIF